MQITAIEKTVGNFRRFNNAAKQDKADNSLQTDNKTVVGAINELKNRADEQPDTVLSIHAPCSSANILDRLKIAAVPLNRNTAAIAVLDKEDENNQIIIELTESQAMQAEIDLSQFQNKSVYIFAAGDNDTTDMDLTFTLKNN